jgi:hypothetical protein
MLAYRKFSVVQTIGFALRLVPGLGGAQVSPSKSLFNAWHESPCCYGVEEVWKVSQS